MWNSFPPHVFLLTLLFSQLTLTSLFAPSLSLFLKNSKPTCHICLFLLSLSTLAFLGRISPGFPYWVFISIHFVFINPHLVHVSYIRFENMRPLICSTLTCKFNLTPLHPSYTSTSFCPFHFLILCCPLIVIFAQHACYSQHNATEY